MTDPTKTAGEPSGAENNILPAFRKWQAESDDPEAVVTRFVKAGTPFRIEFEDVSSGRIDLREGFWHCKGKPLDTPQSPDSYFRGWIAWWRECRGVRARVIEAT